MSRPLESGSIHFRGATEHDVEGIRRATRSSIEGIASADYPKEVTDNWGTSTPTAIQKQKDAIREGRELTWVAERNGTIVGFSAFSPAKEELRAVYVAKEAARQGVGTQLLLLVETQARKLGLSKLEMHSSITAKPFYEYHGYESLGEGIHILSSGIKMKCYHMRKAIAPTS